MKLVHPEASLPLSRQTSRLPQILPCHLEHIEDSIHTLQALFLVLFRLASAFRYQFRVSSTCPTDENTCIYCDTFPDHIREFCDIKLLLGVPWTAGSLQQ